MVELWDLKRLLVMEHLPVTLLVIMIGLTISILLGVGLAISMNGSKKVERAFYPIIITSKNIQIIALAPIFVLWFGYYICSKVIVSILIIFFPISFCKIT